MSLELIYTSAPKGLKPGSRGFCTVAMTQGMPPALVDRLESLSGYRPIFPPQDPRAALNPVVHSQLRISVGGRNYHVLSRISAAGLDYSQRANTFAHHWVLDASELPAVGPAWLLTAPGYMKTAWAAPPGLLPPGRRPPAGSAVAAVCRGWEQLTGDAGWGGVLAQAAADDSRAAATLIFQPGQDPLPLLAESLALLPAELQWSVTFSTYLTKLPPGVECRWRCVLQGSPEAKAAAGLTIDLTGKLGQPPASVYVAAARTGRPPVAVASAPAFSAAAIGERVHSEFGAPVGAGAALGGALYRLTIGAQATNVSAPERHSPPPLDGRAGQGAEPPALDSFQREKKFHWLTEWLTRRSMFAAIAAGVTILTIGGAATWLALRGERGTARTTSIEPPAVTGSEEPPTKPPSVQPPKQKPPEPGKTNAPSGVAATGPSKRPAPPDSAKPAASAPATAAAGSSGENKKPPDLHPVPLKPIKRTIVDPFADFHADDPVGISEYKFHSAIGSPFGRDEAERARLGQIHGVRPADLTLALVSPKDPPDGNSSWSVQPAAAGEDAARWSIHCDYGADESVADFRLDREGWLSFQWRSINAPSDTLNRLSNKLLRLGVKSSGEFKLIPLRRPVDATLPLGKTLAAQDERGESKPLTVSVVAKFLPPNCKLWLEVLPQDPAAHFPPEATVEDSNGAAMAEAGSPPPRVHLRASLAKLQTPDQVAIETIYLGIDLKPADWKDMKVVARTPWPLTFEQINKHIKNAAESLDRESIAEFVDKHKPKDIDAAQIALIAEVLEKGSKEKLAKTYPWVNSFQPLGAGEWTGEQWRRHGAEKKDMDRANRVVEAMALREVLKQLLDASSVLPFHVYYDAICEDGRACRVEVVSGKLTGGTGKK